MHASLPKLSNTRHTPSLYPLSVHSCAPQYLRLTPHTHDTRRTLRRPPPPASLPPSPSTLPLEQNTHSKHQHSHTTLIHTDETCFPSRFQARRALARLTTPGILLRLSLSARTKPARLQRQPPPSLFSLSPLSLSSLISFDLSFSLSRRKSAAGGRPTAAADGADCRHASDAELTPDTLPLFKFGRQEQPLDCHHRLTLTPTDRRSLSPLPVFGDYSCKSCRRPRVLPISISSSLNSLYQTPGASIHGRRR